MAQRTELQKEYYRNNQDRIYAKQKEYKAAHKKEIAVWQKEYHKKWYLKNKEKVKVAAKEYQQKTRQSAAYIAQRLLVFARYRAKRDSLPFNLSLDDLTIPSVCPVFGIPFVLGAKGNHPYAPSLDRIIPNKGYIRGNVQIISYRANTLKRDASINEMEMLLSYMRRVTQ